MNDQRNCEIESQEKPRGGAWAKTLLSAGALLGALAVANAYIQSKVAAPGNALGGTFARFPWRTGDIAYAVQGSGSPVLLLHGLGAGNSMAEWEHNFAALAKNHTVYALDFLGWGNSDRPRGEYSPADFAALIESFARNIIQFPCAVVASSDACALAIEAAKNAPELFTKMVMVHPSTIEEHSGALPLGGSLIEKIAALPILGQSLYNAVMTRRYMRRFCENFLYFDKAFVDSELVSRFYKSAHQPGARYGIAAFLSGKLRHDARASWRESKHPALLVWGKNSRLNGVENAPEWLALRPDAELEVIDFAMLLPHAERADEWNRAVLSFLAR